MKRLLVSGAGGFLGRHLLAHLMEENYWVATVGRDRIRSPLHFELGRAPWTSDQWAMVIDTVEPDAIFHMAGVAQGSPEELCCVNVELAETLFDALRLTGLRPDLLFAGSAAEYGASIIDDAPATEDIVCQPTSAYGWSKFFQTQRALEFAEAHTGRVVVARIFNLIGAGMPGHLAPGDFARQLARGNRLVVGNLEIKRDYIEVGVAAKSLATLAKSSAARGVVNLCSGRAISLAVVAERLISHSGKKVQVLVDPKRIRPDEKKTVIGSTSKLESFGVSPVLPDIDRAVHALFASAREIYQQEEAFLAYSAS